MKTKLVSVLTLLLCATGCVSTQSIVTGKARAPLPVEAVHVYAKPPAGAVEVAQLTARSDGASQNAMNRAIHELRTQAGRLGANALVIGGHNVNETSGGGFGVVTRGGLILDNSTTERRTVVSARAYFYAKKTE